MATTLAFDVYGTLIDTHAVVVQLESMQLEALAGGRAAEFSRTWRDKQLEYSFRRGLMQNYASFAQCTAQALDYTCEAFAAGLSAQQKTQLLKAYARLPAFADVVPALARLQAAGFRLFAFSNGGADAVTGLLESAGLTRYFDGVVSVEEMRTFKPSPAVYSYFLRQSGATGDSTWLVSSNPFDVIGAVSAGLHAAWVRRSNAAVFDPWGIDPTMTVASLADLQEGIATR